MPGQQNIPQVGTSSFISFEELRFDRNNPRLMTGDQWDVATDEQVIHALREIGALEELVLSIATNGYMNLEPLLIHGPDGGPYTVLEGNRRLAAMKLLADPALARRSKVAVPPNVPKELIDSFKSVLVYRVRQPRDAEAFIGFKHINGPQRWDAYAKALFVTKWYRERRSQGLTIDDIAGQIGDTNDTIRSYIGSVFVLEQAERSGLFEIRDRYNKGRFAFSHLYTALDRPDYRGFLGLGVGWNDAPSENAVASGSIERLREMFRFIYGSKRDNVLPLVKSQNPHLGQLGRCLTNDVALGRLRTGASLDEAFAELEGGRMFGQALAELMSRADKAMSLSTKYDGASSLLSLIGEIEIKVRTIADLMKSKTTNSKATPKK